MKFSKSEIDSDFFGSFPHNYSLSVCPTDAINISAEGISIDENKCIGCAICMYRCPSSAIAYNNGVCSVQRSINILPATINAQEKQFNSFLSLPESIKFTDIEHLFLSENSLRLISNSDASDLIVRNCLLNMGIHCNSYAKGNQHNRIEFFALHDGKYLIGESETANDTLSVTRRLLDDMAVLVSRYGIPVENILPIAVLNRLPNKRTDFYEVIEDISNVLKVQISTITYFGLFILSLYNIKLSASDLSKFIINRTHTSIFPYLRHHIPELDSICSLCNTDFCTISK